MTKLYEAQGREFKESILCEADIVVKLGDWEPGETGRWSGLGPHFLCTHAVRGTGGGLT